MNDPIKHINKKKKKKKSLHLYFYANEVKLELMSLCRGQLRV